ncbi:Hypothetical predicted protein [Xyrichtys novacula]|uniref:Uncharacterized protein n=1 Tax=Xyrichtys novacula TaxID=13765 RepID=A0AAV1HIN6_XYRNO|nr:Hypothetical predicted protein [Xyrichtys novacula]
MKFYLLILLVAAAVILSEGDKTPEKEAENSKPVPTKADLMFLSFLAGNSTGEVKDGSALFTAKLLPVLVVQEEEEEEEEEEGEEEEAVMMVFLLILAAAPSHISLVEAAVVDETSLHSSNANLYPVLVVHVLVIWSCWLSDFF